MLILFDIDGTLLRTDGIGMKSMNEAGRSLFGAGFSTDGIEVAGRLDTLIWRDAAAGCDLDDPDADHDRFRSVYIETLERNFAEGAIARLMPGVAVLVESLAGRAEVTVGLLTGNYPESARLKIAAAGLQPDDFVLGAYGCDGTHRRELPPVAMKRCETLRGKRIESGRVIVIGDTPHDVDCARVNGCRSLAVATGWTLRAELDETGADLVLDDLADTAAVLEWMLSPAEAATG